jgi:hypothetical protein
VTAVYGAVAIGEVAIVALLLIRLAAAAHNGSANDYAAYAVSGTLAVVAVLSLVR